MDKPLNVTIMMLIQTIDHCKGSDDYNKYILHH